MSSHELARRLLELPDLPVVSGLSRSGYGEPVDDVTISEAHAYDDTSGVYVAASGDVVDLILSGSSSHSSTPG